MKCMPTATMPHTLVAVWVRNGSAHVLVGARDWRERPEGEAHVHEDVEVPGLVRELVVGGGVLHQGNVLLHPDLQPWGKRGAWAWARGALGVRGSAGSAGQSP